MEHSDPDLDYLRKKNQTENYNFHILDSIFFSISVSNHNSVNCFLLQEFFSFTLRIIAWFLIVKKAFLKPFSHVS